jgi:ribosomal protein S18 acetylase RimI-like enzyme
MIQECERRIARRRVEYAALGVTVENSRARELYTRLGYVECARDYEEWDEPAPGGGVRRVRYEVVDLRKRVCPEG